MPIRKKTTVFILQVSFEFQKDAGAAAGPAGAGPRGCCGTSFSVPNRHPQQNPHCLGYCQQVAHAHSGWDCLPNPDAFPYPFCNSHARRWGLALQNCPRRALTHRLCHAQPLSHALAFWHPYCRRLGRRHALPHAHRLAHALRLAHQRRRQPLPHAHWLCLPHGHPVGPRDAHADALPGLQPQRHALHQRHALPDAHRGGRCGAVQLAQPHPLALAHAHAPAPAAAPRRVPAPGPEPH